MGESVPGITVTPWRTREARADDPSAPLHDCLTDIALEQAILERMKKTGTDWETASKQVGDGDVSRHLDVVCDDNGFRRLDGSGAGRDPNLIHTGERIKVRIAPSDLGKAAPGVEGSKETLGAYNKAITGESGGVDLNRKTAVDGFIGKVPGFERLPEGVKTAVLETYARPGVDQGKLAVFANSPVFASLDTPEEQVRVLSLYGMNAADTARLDTLAAKGPVKCEEENQIALMATTGYAKLLPDQRVSLFERYTSDPHFQGAVNQIVRDDKFRSLDDAGQAHSLDILRRYSGREGEGYGEVGENDRTDVLLKLFGEVLTDSAFKVSEMPDGRDTKAQTERIDGFAEKRAPHIKSG